MPDVDRLIWRDGRFVRWRDATVHLFAQSLQRGSLAFDFVSSSSQYFAKFPRSHCSTLGERMLCATMLQTRFRMGLSRHQAFRTHAPKLELFFLGFSR